MSLYVTLKYGAIFFVSSSIALGLSHKINKFQGLFRWVVGLLIACPLGVLCHFYVDPHYRLWKLESAISKEADLNTIANYYPNEYEDYLKKMKQHFSNGNGIETADEHTIQFIQNAFLKALPNAPLDKIASYLEAQIKLYNFLHSVNPELVVRLELGSKEPFPNSTFRGDKRFTDLTAALNKSKTELIKAAAETPSSTFDKKHGEKLYIAAFQKLTPKYTEDEIMETFNPQWKANVLYTTRSKIIIDFYQEIINLGQNESGIAFKYLLGYNAA